MRKEGDKRKIKEMKDKRSNIPRVETKKRECWKFLDWRMNSENDSRVHGQPSFASLSFLLFGLPSWVIILFLSAIVFSLLNKDFIKHYKQDYHWRWEKWRCKKRTKKVRPNKRTVPSWVFLRYRNSCLLSSSCFLLPFTLLSLTLFTLSHLHT